MNTVTEHADYILRRRYPKADIGDRELYAPPDGPLRTYTFTVYGWRIIPLPYRLRKRPISSQIQRRLNDATPARLQERLATRDDPARQLTKAGALIAAAIDALNATEGQTE